jgi:GTPase SAR1 family protein
VWSDNETGVDLLGFEHLKTAVLSIVHDESLLPATIGVYGDWGSGKSSLMRMVREDLEREKDVVVLSFNGWLFEGYEDAKTALMGTIVDEIIARRTLGNEVKEKAKRLGYKLIKKIQIFRLLGVGARAVMAYAMGGTTAAGAVLAADGASFVAEQLKNAGDAGQNAEHMELGKVQEALQSEADSNIRRSIREFREEFAELLKQTDVKTLVVLIDDLDRCMPDTIIETLEAIKLFLFVPRTAFIIGADERLVRYAVRRRFPELPGEKVEVGQDYLEKLVQYPVRVPPLGRAEIETYINLLFTKKAKVADEHFEAARRCVTECEPTELLEVRYNYGIAQEIMGDKFPKDLGESLALAQRIAPVLAVGLTGNPRQCKRFLNTLVMRAHMARSRGIELKPAVLAKLMLLERFYTESYKRLAKAQAEEGGRPAALAAAERALREPPPTADVPTDGEEDGEGTGSVRKGKKPAKAAPTTEIPDWLADPALKEWTSSEPPLTGEDLRPYFYFSRDTLGPLASVIQRMSPLAQEILTALFQPGKAQLGLTLKRAVDLGPGDASAVFQAVGDRARTEDDPGREESALWRLLDWADVRRELFAQAMTLLADLPEQELPVSLAPRVRALAKTSEEQALAKRVLEKWSKSTANSPLKGAAGNQLTKF